MSSRTVLSLALVLALPAGAFAQKFDNEKVKVGDRLAKKISLDKFEGTFAEAVKMLAEKFDLPLVIDPSVGRGEAMAACDADGRPVKLPKLLNVRVDTALKLVCEQVGAVALAQPDHIKITDAAWALYETGIVPVADPGSPINPNDEPALLSQVDMHKSKPLIKRALVTGVFKSVALGEIIDEIAESTGATVVVSPTIGEKAKKTLTVRFSNTPVDAAVRTLCEMAELGAVEDANVLLVTTPERAASRTKDATDKRKARLAEVGGVGILGGCLGTGFQAIGGGLGGAAASPVAAEIAQLKEQNEAMKKQIEELQKSIKK